MITTDHQMKRILITILILCTAYAAVARNVTGVVRSGAQPLAGVVVSDGENFAVTDAKGAFKLKASDAAEFVYIATPSGYSAPIVDGVVKFYERLDKIGKKDKVVFELTRISDSDDFVVFTVADPQTGNRRHMNRFIKETEPDMQAVAKDYQAKGMTPVGLYLGDIAWDHLEFFDDYKKHTARLGFPVYQTIGNHDYDLKVLSHDHTRR